jgi:serine protease Do
MENMYRKAFFFGVLGAAVCNTVMVLGIVSYLSASEGRAWLSDVLHVSHAQAPVVLDSTGAPNEVVGVVEAANPAVVSIVITKDVPVLEQYFENTSPFGNGFSFPGFGIPQYRQNGTEKKEVGGGSGFLVSEDGYVVTNAHVVNDEEAEYTVFLNDGVKYDATVLARDTILDVALLKIEATGLPYLEFGNSDDAKVGQTVVAIGNALGEYRNTVSVGVISGLSRSVTASTGYGRPETLSDVLQTDAAINPGNSGGPLIDLSGHVIGVNVAASLGSAENIGFSLPANAVKESIDSIREHGRVIRPFLGVRYIPVTDTVKKANGLSVDYGVLLVRGDSKEEVAVVPGSPADKAGLVENDIILTVDGKKVTLELPLENILHEHTVGERVPLTVLHDGEEKTVEVTLEENKNE